MKKEPADVKVELEEEIPDEHKEIRKKENILEDKKDLEFLFKGIACLPAVAAENEEVPSEAEKRVIDAQVAEAWRLLEETSYLSDPEYNAPASPEEAIHDQEEEHHPNHANTGEVKALPDNDMENPRTSSEAATGRQSSNTSCSLEEHRFLCSVCGKTSRTSLLFEEHKKLHEKNRQFKCDTCNKYFSTENAFRKPAHHVCAKQKTYDISDKAANRDNDMQVSEINSISKEDKSKILTQNLQMKSQESSKDESGDSKACGKESKEMSSRETDQCITKRGKYFVCNICNKLVKTKCNLKVHLHTHTGEKKFVCNVCGKRFTGSDTLKRHRCVNSGAKSFECKECGKIFAQHAQLKIHLTTHTYERPFKCEVCGKDFSKKKTLNAHMRSHSAEKPFVCSFCGTGFREKGNLKAHIRIHTGEKPYKCTTCGKDFTGKTHLTRHSRVHSIERPFVCSVCDKSFKNKDCLKEHIQLHTGEKPFKCKICGKEFTRRAQLSVHSHTHSVEKTFFCSVCGKGFKHKTNLTRHIRTHMGGEPFYCVICKTSFTSKGNLARHIKGKHT